MIPKGCYETGLRLLRKKTNRNSNMGVYLRADEMKGLEH